jgi:hypothetical protein
MKFATEDDSQASQLVMYSILSLSSFIRDGEMEHTAEYKSLALRAMAGTVDELPSRCAAKHIAASLLLCVFEVCLDPLS